MSIFILSHPLKLHFSPLRIHILDQGTGGVRTYVLTYVHSGVRACVRACVRAYARTYARTYGFFWVNHREFNLIIELGKDGPRRRSTGGLTVSL